METQKAAANSLWSLRHTSGLEIKQVAKMIGLNSASTLSRYERGLRQPRLRYVIKLSLVYNADLKEMFPGLVNKYRNEIADSIKQRSFVFAWPQRQRVLEDIHSCSYEDMLEGSELTDDDKRLIRKHLVNISNKLARF